MSARIIPFPAGSPEPEPAFSERIAARRAYRAGMKRVAEMTMCAAFTQAGKIPGSRGIGVDVALPIFVAAMRRELRKTGLL
jgi:hypothetical protein